MALPDPSLLDPTGCLIAGAALPTPAAGYLVFGQETPAPFSLAVLRPYAARFLDAKVGLSAEKRRQPPEHDLAFILVHHADVKGTVAVEARRLTDSDHALVARAEAAHPSGGLAELAQRCTRVFVVHAGAPDDATALLVACLLSGTSLGPSTDLTAPRLFGVKSGRERLARAVARRAQPG
ncbi:MAG: hypothetical protein IPF92_03700 [Myxococcales bacterium]|nr:hypothetical protein [Myxococcales bacterium]MBL0196633.1 hypothetical protein [Myxococcales bacterium]HQY62485.1 hypothetical protein [Polyangiaceae bacterium]